MAFRFDERALQLIQSDSVVNLAAWGSYPVLIAPIYKLLDLLGLISIRISVIFWLNQILGLATVYLCFRILNLWKIEKIGSYTTLGVLLLFNPLEIYINSQNISETLFQFLTLGFFAVYFGAIPVAQNGRALALTLLLVLSLMCRNIILPFIFVLPLYFYSIRDSLPEWLNLKKLVIANLTGVILIFAAGQINSTFDSHKYTSLSLNRGANVAQSWCEARTIEYKNSQNSLWFHPPAYWSLEKTRSIMTDTDFNDSLFYYKMAFDCLSQDPELIFFRLRSALQVITGPLFPDPLRQQGAAIKLFFSALAGFALILTILFSRSLYRNPSTRILLLFILCLVAGVYAGNPGESRFLYSMIPILAILISYLLSTEQPKKILSFIGLSLLLVIASFKLPSLAEATKSRDQDRFQKLSTEARLSRIQEKLKRLTPTKTLAELCPQEHQITKICLDARNQSCSSSEKQQILQFFESLTRKVLSEENLYCRNYFLLLLRDQANFEIPAQTIQRPSELPGGVQNLKLSLVRVAVQLMQVDLLLPTAPELIPQNESYDQLLYSFLNFQHRHKFNRPEYRDKVVMYRSEFTPSNLAENYFLHALQTAERKLKKTLQSSSHVVK